MIPAREQIIRKLITIGSVIGEEGLDLLQSCLHIDPSSRISAEHALRHPYLTSVGFNEETVCSHDITAYNISSMDHCQLLTYMGSLRQQEIAIYPDSKYMESQPIITEKMRSILVDWIIDVSVHFEVTDETLHLAIAYIDRALSTMHIDKSRLQLLGVTCMKIADVYNEKSKEYYRQENASEYAYITADEYTDIEVLEMEKTVLNMFNFRLQNATTLHFIKTFSSLLKLETTAATLGQYLADLTLLNYESLQFQPSLLAAAILYIASKQFDEAPTGLEQCREAVGWHTEQELQVAVEFVRNVWIEARNDMQFARFDAVNSKYESQHSLQIRSIWPAAIANVTINNWFS